ncbi:MAG: TPM domain-containing protein [Rhodospirillaceae bacterium]|nr:TPM domain-containing protein [Rhodospirillaceae bacterium]
MVGLTQGDKDGLERAVAAAEKRTSAEIVLCVTDMCDDYRLYALPYAALFGLLVFGVLAVFMPDLHVRTAFLATGTAIIVAALALQWRPLRILTAPRAVREEAAEHLARAEFAQLVAGRTSAANGLLIFVALAEHHAEIVPEPGLAARIPQTAWRKIMDDLTRDLAAGRVRAGIEAAIAACGDAASAVFPPGADDRDELSNAPRSVEPH